MSDTASNEHLTLRDLSFSSRLVVAAFLVSVGLGYLAALSQLYFQIATPGKFPPTAEDVISAYHGLEGKSQLERLLETDESKPFNGQGSMRSAFTKRSGGKQKAIEKKANDLKLDPKDPANQVVLEREVSLDRDGERMALIDWIEEGAKRDSFENSAHVLSAKRQNLRVTEDFVVVQPDGTRAVTVAKIVEVRCARCHSENVGGPASEYPLDEFHDVELYLAKTHGTGMSLTKLAQTSHVHLMGFSVLWGATGLIFSFTSYPKIVRFFLAPLPLVAQIADISCWWLARLDVYGPYFAQAIMFTGGVVGLGVLIHILGGLWDLFGKCGKMLLIVLLLAGAAGGGFVFLKVIDPFLKDQAAIAAPR